MTKKQYLFKAECLFNYGKINQQTYEEMVKNVDLFVDQVEVYKVYFSDFNGDVLEYETESEEQAYERKRELSSELYLMGHRDYCYYVKVEYKKLGE